MVQFRDIFPALLLVGCAGKTVLSCGLYSGTPVLLLGCSFPCARPLLRTGGVHAASRVAPQAFCSAGAAVAPDCDRCHLACIRLYLYFIFCF